MACVQELHRRGVVPVKGVLKIRVREAAFRKLQCEADGTRLGIRSWARATVDELLSEVAHERGVEEEQAERLTDWVSRNRANFEKRQVLARQEGDLLGLLEEVARRQDAAERVISERMARQEEETLESSYYDETIDLIVAAADLDWLEFGVVGRLGAVQDEAQLLLEALVEEVPPDECAAAEEEQRLEEAEDRAVRLPVRGGLRMVHSAAYDRRRDEEGTQASQRLDAAIDRLLASDSDPDSPVWTAVLRML